MCTSDGSATIRRGASFDISFWTETLIPRRSTASSCALIPMVVLMQVASAVATRSVGENASPLPLLSVGASVEIFDCDGPCVASQCKLPVYLTSTLTMTQLCDVFGLLSCRAKSRHPSNDEIRMTEAPKRRALFVAGSSAFGLCRCLRHLSCFVLW